MSNTEIKKKDLIKKYIQIDPIHEETRDCFDSLFVSFLALHNKRFELIFSESWNFSYNPKEFNTPNAFGRAIKPVDRNFALFEKYYRFKVTPHIKSPEEMIEIAKSELDKNKPVAIFINGLWCPWHPIAYKQSDADHSVLLVGYDDSLEMFRCVDTNPLKEEEYLPYDHFINGTKETYELEIFPGEGDDHDSIELLKNAISIVKGKNNTTSMFDSMELFAKDITKHLDIKLETQNLKDSPFVIPLFEFIKDVHYGRKRFSVFLDFINENIKSNKLNSISEEFMALAQNWDSIRGMLIKACFLDDPKRLIKRSAEKIIDIKNKEENMMLDLENLTNASFNEQSDDNQASHETTQSLNENSDREYTFIDLKEIFNNVGFGSYSDKIKASFSGGDGFFLSDTLPENNRWEKDDMKFNFPVVNHKDFDNISCIGQVIEINSPDSFIELQILGTSEWGSHTDKLTLFYETGKKKEIPIGFTDWTKEPIYNEKIAWIGEAAYVSGGKFHKFGMDVYIFSQNYKLDNNKKIEKIQLANDENIHIFAISLVS